MAMRTQILPERYRDAELIARGAMGDIYRATDSVLGRVVALKLLAEPYVDDESVQRRFAREARAAARLSSDPNIVTIYDVGESADVCRPSRRRSSSEPPSTYSMTMYGCPSASPTS